MPEFFTRGYALSGSNLVSFDLVNPTVGDTIAITGVAGAETLVGIDFRPLDGLLYGVGINDAADTGTLYSISLTTGVATAVGAGFSVPGLPAGEYGIDFNAQVDRIRVTTDTGLNFRINPNTGGIAGLDTMINGVATGVSANAYTNNAAGETAVTLYTLDATTDLLLIQNGNTGTQTFVAPVTLGGITLDFTSVNGFDIPVGVRVATANAEAAGSGLALLTVGGVTGFYSIDLTTGEAARIGDFLSGAIGANGFSIPNGLGGPPVGPGDVVWQRVDDMVATGVHELRRGPIGFEIQGSGDFDGDGDSDILWRNDDTLVSWELADGNFLFELDQPSAHHTWQVGGIGDFDGDGDDDVVLQHEEGAVTIWEMAGGNYERNHNLPSVDPAWQIAGTGDFDRDGDDDIVWRHDGGAVTIWEMQDSAFVVNHNLGVVPTSWQIADTGDFDADGDADILWRHDEGGVTIWEIENAALVVNHNQPAVATSWQIEGTHDFDHDGDDDILWRNDDDGQVVTWEMQNGNYVVNHNFGVTGSAWQVAGTGEFDLV
jgi:uncharacterized protein DUF4394/VCBS repeat protein